VIAFSLACFLPDLAAFSSLSLLNQLPPVTICPHPSTLTYRHYHQTMSSVLFPRRKTSDEIACHGVPAQPELLCFLPTLMITQPRIALFPQFTDSCLLALTRRDVLGLLQRLARLQPNCLTRASQHGLSWVTGQSRSGVLLRPSPCTRVAWRGQDSELNPSLSSVTLYGRPVSRSQYCQSRTTL
jgi:hypothetical protein